VGIIKKQVLGFLGERIITENKFLGPGLVIDISTSPGRTGNSFFV